MEYIYRADIISDPDGGFVVTFPDVPEAITGGTDMREALENAADGLGCALRVFYLAENKPLPQANYRGGAEIDLDTWDTLKIGLIEAFKASGLMQKQLAARLGVFSQEVQRLLDPKHGSKVQPMEQALAALGKRPRTIIQDIAAAA